MADTDLIGKEDGEALQGLYKYLRCKQELNELVQSNPQLLESLEPELVACMQIFINDDNLGADVIKDRLDHNTALRDAAEEYIACIDDDFIRDVFIYRFVQGYNWAQVAEIVDWDQTPQSLEALVTQYLEQHP